MPRRIPGSVLVVAVALSLAFSACSQPQGAPEAEWGPLAVWRSDDFGHQALLAPEGGVLVIGEDCVVVRYGGHSTTLAWPDGSTEWDEDGATIAFREQTLRDGDTVKVGGSSEGVDPEWIQEPRATCPDDVWFVSGVEVVEPSQSSTP